MPALPLSIAAQWEMFESRVIDPKAPAIQRQEMQMAFYAGIHCMQCMQLAIASINDDAAAIRAMDALVKEMSSYANLFSVPTTMPN
ncbi:hypothetical protein SAMN05445504_2388 [Burkholderia sp. CF099]|nr:hypothetical protein SAMN05445504_2388 [Burkholderia sp. CF099]